MLSLLARWTLRLLGWKINSVIPPGMNKCIIAVAPHTSFYDFVIGRLAYWKMGIKVKFLIKKESFRFPFKRLLLHMGGIPVDRGRSSKMVDEVVGWFDRSESLYIVITPEGTRKPVKHWKKGFYYIALKAGVPIALGFLDSEAKQFSSEQRCIIPGAYYAITTDREKVISGYTSSVPENIFNVSYLPSMPDDRGRLLLLNRHLDKIDEVIYTEKMHYSLLSGNEGISLEKIRPDLPSDESINWHSASESSGWGTPGAQNSVFSRGDHAEEKLTFSSQKISPDNDGYEDVLVIDINTGDPGSTITVTLFDETGSYIRRIVENYLAGDRAAIVWDGTAEDGSPVCSGIYIILTEMFNDKGKTEKWKKVIAVVRR